MLRHLFKIKLSGQHYIRTSSNGKCTSSTEQIYNNEKMEILENGVFAVNKIKDIGSTEVVEIIKKELRLDNLTKVGHGGVLDKSATGVLVIGVCNGCKILPKFLHGTKKYEVKGQLGISTTTFNETGEIVDQLPYDHVTEEILVKTLEQFVGEIMQTPPVYSALKFQGRRYSDLAREGKILSPNPRLVKCYSLNCTYFEPPFFSLSLKCGGGFYVRSLINDLGKAVGSCAHIKELHRIQHGVFEEREALNRENWTEKHILRSILSAKKRHKHLFKDNIQNNFKNKIAKKEKEPRDTSILIEDDLFDL